MWRLVLGRMTLLVNNLIFLSSLLSFPMLSDSFSQAISQSGSYLEKLSIIFMDVGRSAPRYQSIALLYSRSKELQAYLCEYFIAVVGLCQETANFAKKSTLGQISSNLVDSAIKKFQSDLDLWARSIKEEVTLLSSQTIKEEAKDNSTFRGLVLKSASATSYRRKMQARLYWLDACSTYDYVTTWKQARKRGSPTWFIQSTKYLDWRKDRESPRSDSLYLTGTLGSGKTVLMASMIDDLNLFAPKGTTAYFFCRHDINESLKARTVIGCLARQLIQQSANIDKLDEEFGEDLFYVDCDVVIQILGRVLSGTSKVYHFVLDGVDDCEDSERDALLQLLRQLQRKIPLLLCVSFRAGINSELITGPGIFTSLQILSIPANNPDIGEFIAAELEARLESGKLSIGNAAIILEIQDALQAGAQGM
jgi:ankyrin repeat domain-containing protein 50